MEGDGVTDSDFLDDPANIIPGAPGALRLDDREKLFQESVERDFYWWRPEPRPGQNAAPWISDLAQHRWYRRPFTPDEELAAVRWLQADRLAYDKLPLTHSVGTRLTALERKVLQVAYDKLLAGFHGKILQVANGHMPKRWRQRLPLRDKHTNNLFFEDLVAAGVAAMWKAALKFDLGADNRFWTGVRAPVLGAISDEGRIWRRHGSGEGRLDRWLYTHPSASPEQVLRAQARLVKRPVFHSLQEAAEGIKLFWAWSSEFDYSTEADEKFAAGDISCFAGMYSCFNRFTLSAQLRIHERFSDLIDRFTGGLDFGPGVGSASRPKAPRDLLDYTETAVVQFKNGKRQVTRQRARWPANPVLVTPALRAKAKKDLEFAGHRWQRRTRRGPLPAPTYPRWSTKFGLGRPEHENKQIVPAYIPGRNKFEWFVRYRSAEGDVLSLLESPSWHCLKPKPCEFCETARGNSRTHDVALQSIPSGRALDRGCTIVELRSQDRRTEPRMAETQLETQRRRTAERK